MDKQITGHVLRYLLDHCFESKSDMARQLDIQQRTIQRVFENLDTAKAGTIALDKALSYCVRHHVSLDGMLGGVAPIIHGEENKAMDNSKKQQAFAQLRLGQPENLTATGIEMYDSMLRFLQKTSALVCPNCETWCNPWDGKHFAEKLECYIGHMAREILSDIAELYAETDDPGRES